MLRLEGYTVRTALSAEAGLRDAESSPPDAMIVDLRMPDMNGLEFLRWLRTRGDDTPVIIVTGDYLIEDAISAQLRELGALVRFKPLWVTELANLVDGLLNPHRVPSEP